MMLNSYLPNMRRRDVIASLAIGTTTALALSAGDSFASVASTQAIMGASASPLSLALYAAPSALALLLAGLGIRQSRLSRQLSDERASMDALRHAAYHDSLTGLRNRHALIEDFAAATVDRNLAGESVAVLLFDLDRFKFINDTMGHAAGDVVLKALGGRIAGACGPAQRAYRLGGDEFVVFWDCASGEAAISSFCRSLATSVFKPVEHGGGVIETSGSIGITLMRKGESTLSDMLKRADLALYRAKETPGLSYSLFTQSMDCDYKLRRGLEADMRAGLKNGAFNLSYLPVFAAGAQGAAGFSAQLTWTHPDHGLVAPELFIPLAEENGLTLLLGRWLLRRALADAAGWAPQIRLIVPLSAHQLSDPGFVTDVIAMLAAAGVAAQRLVFDLRSNAVPAGNRAGLQAIEQLRGAGVEIAVSDFSAGIAGLAMTRPHAVDRVRLDLEHVKAVAGEERFAQMLSLFLQLASTVETPVTLTGVDSPADLECAIAAGVSDVEGRFSGPPLSAEEVLEAFGGGELRDVPRLDRLAG